MSADEMIEQAREALRPPGVRRPATQPPRPGDIVVTANVPETLPHDLYPDDPANADNNAPRAPDLFGIPPGGLIVARGCFIPPCPRPMPPLIDLLAIPEAPPGSDAARYAE